jgi:hypothetical protein
MINPEEEQFIPPAEPKEAFRTPQMFRDYMQIIEDLDEAEPACANFPDAYFPELQQKGFQDAADGAKAMCEECPALLACRTYGIKWEQFGIWGGLGERERRAVRKTFGIRMRTDRAAG